MPPGRKKAKPAPNPTAIQNAWFERTAPLSTDDLEGIRANTEDEAFDLLIGDHWNGGIISYLTIDISQNNQTPVGSSFNLKGNIFADKEKIFKSTKFFNLTEPLYISFSNLDCMAFNFHNSGLVSNYVDSSEFSFEFRKEKQSEEFPLEDVTDFPGFSLRAYAAPTEANWVRLTIHLYPLDVDSLLEYCDSTISPWWPGVSFFSELIPLNPAPTGFFDGPSRGLAVVPALVSAAPFSDDSKPTTTAIIASISATLRTACFPESKTNVTQLLPRWTSIKSEGANALKTFSPDLLWPEPALPLEPPQGRISLNNAYFILPPPLLYSYFFYSYT